MNWKTVLVLVALAAVAYGGYRYWNERQGRNEFCLKLRQCTPTGSFVDEFGSVEECRESDHGQSVMEDFADCPLEWGCQKWMACGYDLSTLRSTNKDPNHKTNFEQVQPFLE